MTEGNEKKSLAEYKGKDRVISSLEMEAVVTRESHSIFDVRSGIPSIDRYVDGFRDGEVYAVSGPTKNGKTLLAQTLTVNFAKQNAYSLWFTFEVPARQFLSQFDELPLFYMPTKLKTYAMDWLEERILESFAKYHTRIVFIDHLHYLFDMARTRNTSLEIGTVIRKLKTIAVNNGFCIFLLCHTTKGKSDDNLSYESIRDSSFVSQESDCVLMVKRTPGKGSNRARCRIEFHRRTGVLEKVIELEKHGSYLRELSKQEEPEQWWQK